jgi:fatty acyl-CoA reductase
MLKLYQKIHKFTDVLAYFTTQQWTFSNDNVQNLWKNMSPEDKHLFKFDITLVEWKEIIFRGTKGIKLYMWNEPILVEKAAARYRRFVYISQI